MKIVVIHHFYRNGSASGENTIVSSQIDALRKYGHEVVLIGRHSNKTLATFFSRLKVGLTWAINRGEDPSKTIAKIQPDLVIVHNLYPGFTSRWISNTDLPKIYWMHNYRFFCIASTFVYKNQECFICSKSISYKALFRKCADNSIFKSLSTFLRIRLNSNLPEKNNIDYWVTLSPKAKKLFLKTDIDPSKLKVIPNFVSSNLVKSNFKDNHWVFVGRLTTEKGILALAKNLPESIILDIYGDGPIRPILESLCETRANIHLKGDIDRQQLIELLPNYVGGFVPSLGVEGIPTTFLEFAAAGLPVIGWEMNSTSDFIRKYGGGIVLKNFETVAISSATENIALHRTQFSNNSTQMWRIEFSEDVWIKRVNILFDSILQKGTPP